MSDARTLLQEAQEIAKAMSTPAPAPAPTPAPAPAPEPVAEPAEAPVPEHSVNDSDQQGQAQDWREMDIASWIGAKAGTSYNTQTLKSSLYKDFGSLSGEQIDVITKASEQHAQVTIEASKGEIPYSSFGALVRSSAAFLAKDALVRAENERIHFEQKEQDLKNVAREEFGGRHYVALMEEAERNYAKEMGIPVQEVRNLSTDRYRNVLAAYQDRKYGKGAGTLTADVPSKKDAAVSDYLKFMSSF